MLHWSQVIVKIKSKSQNLNVYLCLYQIKALNGSENQGTIKELLVLKFDCWRSKNKELLELGLELSSLYKKAYILASLIGKQSCFRDCLIW